MEVAAGEQLVEIAAGEADAARPADSGVGLLGEASPGVPVDQLGPGHEAATSGVVDG